MAGVIIDLELFREDALENTRLAGSLHEDLFHFG
jgi:hypothetical protein